MKRIICLLLAMLMLCAGTAVSANERALVSKVASSSKGEGGIAEKADMESALISVKSKITVPSELDVFESSSYMNDNKTILNFNWRDKDYKAYMQISCDDKGRINNYYYYSEDIRGKFIGKKLAVYSKSQALEYAEEFLKKAVPEAFEKENDRLFYDETSAASYVSENGTDYNFNFERKKDGVPVKNNSAYVNVNALGENIYVSSINVSFEYDTEFEIEGTKIPDSEAAYKAAFPAEMIYEKQFYYIPYRDGRKQDENKIDLIYRIKDNNIGLISAYTGEVIPLDNMMVNRYSEDVATEKSMAAGGRAESALTEAEIAELKNISELKTAEEIEKLVRGIEELKLDSNMKMTETRISKNDNGYMLSIYLYNQDENNYHSFSVTVDAKTGKINSLYNYADNYSKEELTDKQKETSEKALVKFIETYAAEELAECEKQESDSSRNNYTIRYRRLVNGVPYINNSIYATYDGLNDMLLDYNVNFDKNGEFADPQKAITADDAYQKILKEAPLSAIYAKSDGKFRLCYTLDYNNYLKIDALTGEPIKNPYGDIPQNSGNYSDIKGHWSENSVLKLAEVGIALAGDQFLPDSEITQEDFLRFLGAGLYYTSYLYDDADTLYNNLFYNNVLAKEERNESAPVTREEAFVYIIRMAGLERVAKLSKIFKVDFADKADLSEDRKGYAAILSGLNVICGDGGYLRAKDKTTRAEAATMLYNYLMN